MMISGANHLYNNKQTVDELNVFPVPDGDTGTNMSMTANAMAKALSEAVSSSASKTADTASYATLRGARGNSGVILSQFFRGISKGLKGYDDIGPAEFANALKLGSEAAYKAVMKPTEGTILTVSREVAAAAVHASEGGADIKDTLSSAIEKGYKTLEKTPDMLPALKKAGVVDAGGRGWLFFLDGVMEYLKTGEVVKSSEKLIKTPKENVSAQSSVDTKDIKYMYCTEFIVQKSDRDVNVLSFRAAIEKKGDSMLVIDDDDIVKVHIHTNNPGYVLEKAVLLGSMINIKIDNMKYQHQNLLVNAEGGEEKKAPANAEKKPYAFIAVCQGEGLYKIFSDLGIDGIIEGGQTMNPSTEDIAKEIAKVNADTVFIFPNNKNIIMAAEQAKEICDKNTVVIPSKSIMQCIGAMIAFSPERTPEENEARMLKAMKGIKSGQITRAVRDADIDGNVIKEGDVLGLNDGKIAAVGKAEEETLFGLVEKMCDDDSEFLTVYASKDNKDDFQRLSKALEEKFPELEVEIKYGGQALYSYLLSVE